MADNVYTRQSVREFAQAMELRLREKEFRGGWRGLSQIYLFQRMIEEMGELAGAMVEGDIARQGQECADVANFAMMIRENL